MEKLLQALQALTQSTNELIQSEARNWEKMGLMDKMNALNEELKKELKNKYLYILDLYEDSVIAKIEDENYQMKTYKVPYVIKNNVATFGSPVQVERIITYEPVTKTEEDGEDGSEVEQKEIVTYNLIQGESPVPIPLVGDLIQTSLQFDQAELEQAKKNKNAGLKFKNAVATVFEIKNANQQYYPKSIWENNLEQLNKRASNKLCIGQADHPKPGESSVLKQCIRFDNFVIQDNKVLCDGEIIATESGKSIIELAKNGIPVGLSSRGRGTLVLKQMNGENVFVVQDDFYCDTFDAVANPAAEGSYIQSEGPVSQTAQKENSLTQSNKKGENTVNPQLKKLLEELGQAKMLAAQGIAGAAELVQEYEALLQDKAEAADEAFLAAKLGPLSARLGTAMAVKVPADVDKNKPSSNGANFQSTDANQGLPQLDQSTIQAFQANMTAMNQMVLEQAIETKVNSLNPLVQSFVRTELLKSKDSLTVADIATRVAELEQAATALLVGGGVTFNSANVGRTEAEKRLAQAPKTVEDMVQELTADMDDTLDASGRKIEGPGSIKSCLQMVLRTTGKENPKAFTQYRQFRSGQLQQAVGTGDLSTADIADGQFALFPLIRESFPRLIAHRIASIQPTSVPNASIYYLKTKNEDGAYGADNPFYYTYANGVAELSNAKKMELEITKEDIEVTSKKLTSKISYEVFQDMQSQFGLDAMRECLTAQAEEIARERNNQMLVDLAFASNTAGNVNFGKTAPSGYTQVEWETSQMALALESVSNLIYMERYQDMTHILASPAVCLQLQKMGSRYGFAPAGGDANTAYSGVNMFGTINSKWEIWKVPMFESLYPNKALCLYKGADWKDTAIVYSPYTMAITPQIHSADFGIQQGIMERSAQKIVQPKAIGTLTLTATTGTAL